MARRKPRAPHVHIHAGWIHPYATGTQNAPCVRVCVCLSQDMDETVDALVTVSSLPLSVVIVGVGNGVSRALSALKSSSCQFCLIGILCGSSCQSFSLRRSATSRYFATPSPYSPQPFGAMEQLDGDSIALKGRSGTVR